ncbi:MAG: hypothetical protein R3F17_05045 [Planctomycetota bacterium]
MAASRIACWLEFAAPFGAQDHVAAGGVGGVQPEVAAAGVAQGQFVVVAGAATDADLDAAMAFESAR